MRGRTRIGVRGGTGGLPDRERADAGALPVQPRRVLYIEQDCFTAALTRATLDDAGFDVDWFPTARAAGGQATGARHDVYLLRADGEAAGLIRIASLAGEAGVVLIGSERSIEAAIEGCRMLPSPCPPGLLARTVQSAAQGRRQAA